MKIKNYIIDIAAGLMIFGSAEAMAGDYSGHQQKATNYIEGSFSPQPTRMPVGPFDYLPTELGDYFKEGKKSESPKKYIGKEDRPCPPFPDPQDPFPNPDPGSCDPYVIDGIVQGVDDDWCPTPPRPKPKHCCPCCPEPAPKPDPWPPRPPIYIDDKSNHCDKKIFSYNQKPTIAELNKCEGTYRRIKIDLGPIEIEWESCDPLTTRNLKEREVYVVDSEMIDAISNEGITPGESGGGEVFAPNFGGGGGIRNYVM